MSAHPDPRSEGRLLKKPFTPAHGAYIVLTLDPVATLKALNDPVAETQARALVTKKYVGIVAELVDIASPFREYHRCSCSLLSQGLPTPVPSRSVDETMCVPIAPATHPIGRAGLWPSPPLPWENLYHHTMAGVDLRIRTREDDYTNCPLISYSDENHLADSKNRDVSRRLGMMAQYKADHTTHADFADAASGDVATKMQSPAPCPPTDFGPDSVSDDVSTMSDSLNNSSDDSGASDISLPEDTLDNSKDCDTIRRIDTSVQYEAEHHTHPNFADAASSDVAMKMQSPAPCFPTQFGPDSVSDSVLVMSDAPDITSPDDTQDTPPSSYPDLVGSVGADDDDMEIPLPDDEHLRAELQAKQANVRDEFGTMFSDVTARLAECFFGLDDPKERFMPVVNCSTDLSSVKEFCDARQFFEEIKALERIRAESEQRSHDRVEQQRAQAQAPARRKVEKSVAVQPRNGNATITF
ncbi:hypothetical protein FA95DRAFT_444102 [Auriscalpium vulgare]|uniref:Uncharacterized protein n=1 Tax=Auriscalpium vulgare TaxID=40419 RepID=A0ACB8RGP6_9AGAM|nr:hypothetical protein FA95DRAFT_444102 [Auriscalpium vulgare]